LQQAQFVNEALKPVVVAMRADDVKEANNIVVRKIRPLYQLRKIFKHWLNCNRQIFQHIVMLNKFSLTVA